MWSSVKGTMGHKMRLNSNCHNFYLFASKTLRADKKHAERPEVPHYHGELCCLFPGYFLLLLFLLFCMLICII